MLILRQPRFPLYGAAAVTALVAIAFLVHDATRTATAPSGPLEPAFVAAMTYERDHPRSAAADGRRECYPGGRLAAAPSPRCVAATFEVAALADDRRMTGVVDKLRRGSASTLARLMDERCRGRSPISTAGGKTTTNEACLAVIIALAYRQAGR